MDNSQIVTASIEGKKAVVMSLNYLKNVSNKRKATENLENIPKKRKYGGVSICVYNRVHSQCKEDQICVTHLISKFCSVCGRTSICVHNRQSSLCRYSQLCEHIRIR